MELVPYSGDTRSYGIYLPLLSFSDTLPDEGIHHKYLCHMISTKIYQTIHDAASTINRDAVFSLSLQHLLHMVGSSVLRYTSEILADKRYKTEQCF